MHRIFTIPISIVTPVFNDFDEFSSTFKSIVDQLGNSDELIIIDSSLDKYFIKNFCDSKEVKFKIRYFWCEPQGIYPAMNKGISKCNNSFIQILNSGDTYLPSARKLISKNMDANPKMQIFIFDQLSGYDGESISRFSSTESSLWPHQSSIVHYKIYEELGFYSELFDVISDQIFFWQARKICNYYIINEPLTYYDLNGVSSKVSFKNIQETYFLWRIMGKNTIFCLAKSIKLILKVITQAFIGIKMAKKIRIFIFSHFTKT